MRKLAMSIHKTGTITCEFDYEQERSWTLPYTGAL